MLRLLWCLAAGWCADKYRRDLIMRLSGFLMLGASSTMVLVYCFWLLSSYAWSPQQKSEVWSMPRLCMQEALD